MPTSADDFLKQFQGPHSAAAGAADPAATPQAPSADQFLSAYAPPAGAPSDAASVAHAPQQTGVQRAVDKVGSDIVSGTTGLLGLPGTLFATAKKTALAHGVSEGAWNTVVGNLLNTQQMNAGADAAGNALGVGPVVDRPDLAPQNAFERYGDAAVKAAPAIAATIATGGAAAPAVLAGLGGAGAAQGAKDAGLSAWAQLGASLLGGAAGGAGGAALSAPNVERIAATMGTSSTMQQAGEHLQTAARNWLANVKPAQEAAVWTPVNAELGSLPTPLTNANAALQNIVSRGGPLRPSMQEISGNLPENLQAGFARMTETPTWENVKNFRSSLGEELGKPGINRGMTDQQGREIYGALTEDMRSVADSHGYADLFDHANAQSTALNDIAEGPMKKIVASATPSAREDPGPGEAANAVLRGAQHDGSTLQTLREQIPDAVDELAAAHLRMFSPKYAKLNPQGTSPASLSPEAHEALFPDPMTRQLITSVVPKPSGTPALSHGAESIVTGAAGTALEALISHAMGGGSPENAIGAALLGAAAPHIFRAVNGARATPGILPGAALGAAASPSAMLGVTGQSGN